MSRTLKLFGMAMSCGDVTVHNKKTVGLSLCIKVSDIGLLDSTQLSVGVALPNFKGLVPSRQRKLNVIIGAVSQAIKHACNGATNQ